MDRIRWFSASTTGTPSEWGRQRGGRLPAYRGVGAPGGTPQQFLAPYYDNNANGGFG